MKIWDFRLGIYLGTIILLLNTLLLDTIKQVQHSVIFFMLIYGILILIEEIADEIAKRKWKKKK